MNALDGIIDDLNTVHIDFNKNEFTPIQYEFKNLNRIIGRFYDAIRIYKQTGVDPEIDFESDIDTERNASVKENIEPGSFSEITFIRPNATQEATQNTKFCNDTIVKGKVYVKLENMLEIEEKIKREKTMPAPARPAPKKKSRETKAQKKIKKEKSEAVRHSDVIQDVRMSVINLVDSDSENEEQYIGKSNKKRMCPTSRADAQVKSEKRSKSDENENLSTPTVYEDAINATFVSERATSSKPPLNIMATAVMEHITHVQPKNVVDDLMTDDDSVESEEEKGTIHTPSITKSATTTSKHLSSPFEQSPVKRKVEAFEKLVKANAIPVRVTRNTTRQQGSAPKSAIKEQRKMFTPTGLKYMSNVNSATVKASKTLRNCSTDNIVQAKSASALKASQAEYRERERKRREKEEEALKKREALLQAHMEDKKRKREEKQLKAQQQREALEKEKQKAFEMQRLKDERHKQLLAEQEERKQKQKEEVEKKRMMAKAKALEVKKAEEERKLEEQKKAKETLARQARENEEHSRMQEKQKEKRLVPLYLKTRAPLLPTQDCYDSDDESYEKKVVEKPTWARESHLYNMQFQIIKIGETMKNSFFCRQGQTPDLQELFEIIEPRKLKRSSSAVWQRPPRFTMMPMLEEHHETDDFSDDDFTERDF